MEDLATGNDNSTEIYYKGAKQISHSNLHNLSCGKFISDEVLNVLFGLKSLENNEQFSLFYTYLFSTYHTLKINNKEIPKDVLLKAFVDNCHINHVDKKQVNEIKAKANVIKCKEKSTKQSNSSQNEKNSKISNNTINNDDELTNINQELQLPHQNKIYEKLKICLSKNYLLVPCYIHGNHFVFFKVDLQNKALQSYDSLNDNLSNETNLMVSFLNEFTDDIQNIKQFDEEWKNKKWQYQKIECPRQTKNDCAVFTFLQACCVLNNEKLFSVGEVETNGRLYLVYLLHPHKIIIKKSDRIMEKAEKMQSC